MIRGTWGRMGLLLPLLYLPLLSWGNGFGPCSLFRFLSSSSFFSACLCASSEIILKFILYALEQLHYNQYYILVYPGGFFNKTQILISDKINWDAVLLCSTSLWKHIGICPRMKLVWLRIKLVWITTKELNLVQFCINKTSVTWIKNTYWNPIGAYWMKGIIMDNSPSLNDKPQNNAA